MGSRHAIVIGSQCHALRNQSLSFLPGRAQRLYSKLIDPRLGDCNPLSSRLVIDPSLAELKDALKTAVDDAAAVSATLIFAFVGHAAVNDRIGSRPLYLLPTDANPDKLDDDTAYEVGRMLGNTNLEGLDGLIMILDACHAGAGVHDVLRRGLDLASPVRLELLAGTNLRVARDGCFSESLIHLMEHGRPELSVDYLEIRHAANFGADFCQKVQEPPIYIGSGSGQTTSDPGLWISRNVAAAGAWSLSNTPEGAMSVALTKSFRTTSDAELVVNALNSERLVVVEGAEGSGKSAMVGALARPEVIPHLPQGFLSAVCYASLTPTLSAMAQTMERQLSRVPGFRQASASFRAQLPAADIEKLPAMERLVFGPLRSLELPIGVRVRLAIDGLDELDPAVADELVKTLKAVITDPRLEYLGVLVSTRGVHATSFGVGTIALRGTNVPMGGSIQSGDGDEGPQPAAHAATMLELSLLTDTSSLRHDQAPNTTASLGDLYNLILESLPKPAKIVLSILAASGTGPVLPIEVLVQACSLASGPADIARTRDILGSLSGLVSRADPGTPVERVGLFHQTLVEEVAEQTNWVISAEGAHELIVRALSELHTEASTAYSKKRIAGHFWALGRTTEALTSIYLEIGHYASDNSELLAGWLERLRGKLPPEDEELLLFEEETAHWMRLAGDITEAQTLYEKVLDTRLRVLGPEHPETLISRNNTAAVSGETGDALGASRHFQRILETQKGVLGTTHYDTLASRHNAAFWMSKAGDVSTAIHLIEELLEDLLTNLGADHRLTLSTRNNLASLYGETGDSQRAVEEFQILLADQIEALGVDHPDTLRTQHNIASWLSECGDQGQARALMEEVLDREVRILGPGNPQTLSSRSNLALIASRCGDHQYALNEFTSVLEEQQRVLGQHHPDTLVTIGNLGTEKRQAGDLNGAATLMQSLLLQQQLTLSPDHPDTLVTRNNLASVLGECGDYDSALNELREVLKTRVRVLGQTHPHTFLSRHQLATFMGKAGDPDGAAAQFAVLHKRQAKALGPDHPDTLRTEEHLAAWAKIAQAG